LNIQCTDVELYTGFFFHFQKLLSMKSIFWASFMAFACSVFSQSKRDNIWVIGYTTLIPDKLNSLGFGGMTIDFSQSSPKVDTFDFPTITGRVISAISNDTGHLIYYTTGCTAHNQQFEVMDEGENLELPGNEFSKKNCDDYDRLEDAFASCLTLPVPDKTDQYLTFQMEAQAYPKPFLLSRYYYSSVDMSQNNGLGKVVEKYKVVLEDSLQNSVAAVRHGNGRDWWVVIPRGTERQMWIFLVTPNGIEHKMLQIFPNQVVWDYPYPDIDDPTIIYQQPEYDFEAYSQQAVFSPDGSNYVRIVAGNGVEIFGFDRCSGQLTFEKAIPMPIDSLFAAQLSPVWGCGVAISPNNRFLYFTNFRALFQYDLDTGGGDYEMIAKYDGYKEDNFFESTFFLMRLAPNGKIYMSSGSSTRVLHTIHDPNQKGKNCNFKQHDLKLPRWNWMMNDYFPNFNLLDLKDSPCDTLGINVATKDPEVHENASFWVYPNPTDDVFQVEFAHPFTGSVEIMDLNGRVVAGQMLTEVVRQSFQTTSLPIGLYLIRTVDAQSHIKISKVSIFH
jgi:Secretion system C-terminal sorting domain